MRTLKTSTAIFLFLALAAQCADAQPTYFMIGCDNMHHRIDEWTGIRDSSHMPFTAFARARSLGLNTAMLHPVDSAGMNYSALVTKLVNSGHAVGMRTIIHDDSLRQLTIGERRIYQAEETVEFSTQGQGVEIRTDANFNDGQNFDLLAEKRDNVPRPANIIRLTPGVTQNGLVLSGFTHNHELHRDSIIYYLSMRLRLAGTNSLDLNDEVIRVVFRVNNTSIDTTLFGYDFHDGNDFITDVREIFLGSFYFHFAQAEGYHLDRIYEPQNAGGTFPHEPRYKEFEKRFTISASWNIETEIYYFGHGVVHIDQINLSNFYGWGLFVGDEHSLPADQMQQGQTVPPRRQRLEYRINSYPTSSDIPFISMTETWFAEGSLPLVGLVSNLIRNKFSNQTDALFYMNRFSMYGLSSLTHATYDTSSAKRQLTEGNARTMFPYFYMIEYLLPNPNTDSTLYYNDSVQARYFKENITDMKRMAHIASGSLQRYWINTVQNHSWAFINGGNGVPPDTSLESREPNNAELYLQTNLGLAYGAKGVLYYMYNSISDWVSPFAPDSGALGFVNTNLTQRTVNRHNENKWDSTHALNLYLAEMGEEILPLVWTDGFSWEDYATTGRDSIRWIVTQRLGTSTDPSTKRLVEIGKFRTQTLDPNSFYLFVVNKRTDRLGERHITVKLGSPLTGQWRVTNIITHDIWILNAITNYEDNDKGGFTDYFRPGGAWLYRVERFEGDAAIISGCMEGNVTITRGASLVYNNRTLSFPDANRGLIVSGSLSADNSTFRHCSGSQPGLWKGIIASGAEAYINLTNCVVDAGVRIIADGWQNSFFKNRLTNLTWGLQAYQNVYVDSCTFRNNGIHISCFGTSNNFIYSNKIAQPTFGYAIHINSAHAVINSNRVDSLHEGLQLMNATGTGMRAPYPSYFYYGHNKFNFVQLGIESDNSTLYFGDESPGQDFGSRNSFILQSPYGGDLNVVASNKSDVEAVFNYWVNTDASLFSNDGTSIIAWEPSLPQDPNPIMNPSQHEILFSAPTNSILIDTSWRGLFKRVSRGDTANALPSIIGRLNNGSPIDIPYLRWLSFLVLKSGHSGLQNAFINRLSRHANKHAVIIRADLYRLNRDFDNALSLVKPLRNHADTAIAKEALLRSVLWHIWGKGDFKTATRDMDTLYARYKKDTFVASMKDIVPLLSISNIQPLRKPSQDIFWDTVQVKQNLKYALHQNYPNPISNYGSVTNISFSLAENCPVLLDVMDAMGRRVAVVTDQEFSAGSHTIHFNAVQLPSGIYFYRLITNDFTAVRKMVVMR